MNCKFVQDNLVELANGTLPEGVEMEVRSHLLMCDECQKEFESLKSVNDVLGMLMPEVEPSDSIKDTVLARFHVEQSRSYSAKMKSISKESSTPVFFAKWIFLQFRRPIVAGIAAALVLFACVAGLFTQYRVAGKQPVAQTDLQVLPEKSEYDLTARKRVSLITKTAHAQIKRELEELETLDIPEQTWRITDLDPALKLSEVKTLTEETDETDSETETETVENTSEGKLAESGIEYTSEPAGVSSFYGNRFLPRETDSYYEGENIRELIDGGLKWLVSRQKSDGSWGTSKTRVFTTSLSGLCLLAEIGRFTDGDNTKSLERAVKFVRQQGKKGFYGGEDKDGRRAHMTALCFLVEYYNLKGAAELREDIMRGLKYTYSMGQVKGWEFTDSSYKADTSITGWYILLLESSRRAGFSVDRKYFDRARSWVVQSTYGGDEEVAKTRNFLEDDAVKKSVAFMGRFFLKEKLQKKDISLIASQLLAFLSRESMYPESDINPYFLHFAALGLFQNHGREWHIFHREAKRYISSTAALAKDPYGKSNGVYWPSGKRRYNANGDEFYTALNILTLQTYYRFNVIK